MLGACTHALPCEVPVAFTGGGPARRIPLRAGFSIALLIVSAMSCGGDHATSPTIAPPLLRMQIAPTYIGPRQTATIFISLTPFKGDRIADSWLRLVTGDERDSVPIPFAGDEQQEVDVDITAPNAPISARLLFTARTRTVSGRADSASDVLTIGDTIPPRVEFVYLGDTVLVGETVNVGATYEDNSGLARDELHLTGAITRDDAYNSPDFPTDGSIAYRLVVPALPGDSIVQTAVGTDMYGLRTAIRQVYHIESP
jgi:hypothetical protein